MSSNFSQKLIPKKDKLYYIAYSDVDDKSYYEFYAQINTVVGEIIYFTVTVFLRGNEDGRFDEDIQLGWTQKEFDAAYINEMSTEELKELSRCSKCAKKLYFVRTSLLCPVHHFVGGF